jgi:hypothetical protein
MKKIFAIFGFLFSGFVWAQEVVDLEASIESQTPLSAVLEPVITMPDTVPFGAEATLDGTASQVLSEVSGTPSYSWTIFKDGESLDTKFTPLVNYNFKNPGLYTIKLNIKQGTEKRDTTKEVLVYDRQGVFFSDTDQLQELDHTAAKSGLWLEKVIFSDKQSDFSEEDFWRQAFQQRWDFIKNADLLVFMSRSDNALQNFARFFDQSGGSENLDLSQIKLIKISDENLTRLTKSLFPVYRILERDILLVNTNASAELFESNFDQLIQNIQARGYNHLILSENNIDQTWLPLSRLMSYFLINGVSQSILYLLLSVPLLAFVISFFRQFVGVSTFGVFAPLMLSLSFFVLGVQFGLLVFLVVLGVSSVIRLFFERVDLMYIPKLSLLLSFLSLSFFLVLALAIYFESSLNLALTIFPMMIMATLSEKFVASQSSEGVKSAIFATVETVLVSLLAFALADWSWLKNLILSNPEWLFLPIVGTVWLGKFTGLRVAEYFKFRSLFREDMQEE